ncbi:MAG: lysophospholipid acyltransferase family protein [Alphaproteobacteria bacterium]|nr:lysophospholipid acyltransferase family protein [Alphaproteobacteria bacterium]
MIFLRSCLFNLWFYLLTFVFVAAALVPRLMSRLLPSDWAYRYTRLWAWLLIHVGLRYIAGVRYEIRGAEHLAKSGPALLVGNHQSAFDTFIWFLILPRATYVLKRELMRIPLFGGMLGALGLIPIDRSAGAAAIRALLKETDRAVAEARQIIIFPEGTRVAPGVEAPLQPGYAAMAGRSKLPIIPVTTDSGLHWGRRAFRKIPGTINIDVHPPLPASLGRAEMSVRIEALFAAARADINRQSGAAG